MLALADGPVVPTNDHSVCLLSTEGVLPNTSPPAGIFARAGIGILDPSATNPLSPQNLTTHNSMLRRIPSGFSHGIFRSEGPVERV